MKRIFIFLLASFAAVLAASDYAGWEKKIRQDHPRLYVNQDTLPELRHYVRTVRAEEFAALQKEVDALKTDPVMELHTNRYTMDANGQVKPLPPYNEAITFLKVRYPDVAQKCALVYLVTGEEKYAVLARKYLACAIEFFEWCLDHRIICDWHSSLRQNAIVAYDWIYHAMPEKERKEYGRRLLHYVRDLLAAKYPRNSGNAVNAGNYGIPNLQWFIGLTASGCGIDDALAAQMRDEAFRHNLKFLRYREQVSAGSGFLAAPTAGYTFGMYPHATFFFLHFMKSAAGMDLSEDFPQMLDYPNWFSRASIPVENAFLHYGIGDTEHIDNRINLSEMYTHMAQTIHIYAAKHPQKMAATYATLQRLPEKAKKFSSWYPVLPFLLTGFDPAKCSNADPEILNAAPKAARFSTYGLLFSRSGVSPDATYSVFRFGANAGNHSHYDENGFIIYKHNFLAMDSGSRCKNMHHVQYAPQTVAHNCILIHMPGEPNAPFWKPWGSTAQVDNEKVFSHGGQYRTYGGKQLACEGNDLFSYAAGDAAAAYRPEKCKTAIRQFVHIQPDYFVIFDRVESVKADQKKEFLLHTHQEPALQPDGSYRADFGKGRLFVKTLLPANASVVKVGGAGKEFQASGKNWELPGDKSRFKLAGNWRMEISDPAAGCATQFLHVLQAADTGTPAMISARSLEDDTFAGAELTDAKGTVWTVKFRKNGAAGGSVKAVDNTGKILIDRNFTDKLEL